MCALSKNSTYALHDHIRTTLPLALSHNDSNVDNSVRVKRSEVESERVERCETKCVLLNARSLKNKLDDFQSELILGENFPFVIGVTETWLDNSIPNSIFQCKNQYDIFRKDRNANGGGVAILSKKNLKAIELRSDTFKDLEIVAIIAKFKKEPVIFACFYRSSVQNHEILPQLTRAIEYLESKGKPLVLFGDFNLPGIKWGDVPTADVTYQQNEFLEMFLTNGLSQKVSNNTRFAFDAILDLIFVNEPSLVENVRVRSPLSVTCDHNVVLFDLGLRALQDDTEPIKLKLWSKADVVGIGLSLECINWPLFFQACQTVDDMWVQFRILCLDLFALYVPQVTRSKKRKFKYPNNVKNLIRMKKAAFKKRLTSLDQMAEYKRLSVLCSSATKQFHKDRELSIINSGRSSVFKFIRSKLSSKTHLHCLEKGNQQFTSKPDMARILSEQYESVFITDNGNIPPMLNRCDTGISPLTITRSDIVLAISSLKSDSSPGIDKITPWFYKSFSVQLATPLQMIYAKSLSSGEVPKEWLISLVSPIYKGGNKKQSDPASYRPVSLTCVACRIMEKIIKKHVTAHLNRYGLISPHQHGFQSKRSTESQLLECKNDWTKSIDSNDSIDVIYLDIAKAFDTVSHPKLITKLQQYGIRGPILSWINAFLSNRRQAVRVDGIISDFAPVRSGVPQGSVFLIRFFFLIFINDLPDVCRYAILKHFADDSKLYFKSNTIDDYYKLLSDLIAIFE